ncbi:MAG TPA: hypothetical protein VL475_05595 [Planctomycetaceae bacterium]|nr:hypothetical protein [Planctomycetaceae bacterium]
MSRKPRTSSSAPSPPAASISCEPAIPSRADRLIFVGFLLWIFVSLIYPLYDTDFWWHLRTGELMLQGNAPPQVDLYTFTDSDKAWIDLHWGFQVLIAVLHRLGGVNLVIFIKAGVITAAVAIAWLASGRSLPGWLKAPLWTLPVIAISGRGYERPEMLSQLFLAVWLFVAFRVERRPRLIWLLPAVQLLWVNCHALFVLGLVVGVCYIADCVARDLAKGKWGLAPPARAPEGSTLIRAGGLVALACFVSPYFEEGALFPLTLYRKFTVEQAFYSVNIGEFQQPIRFVMKYGLTNIYLIAEVGVLIMTAASFIGVAIRRRQWSVLRLALFVAFSHLAWEASRNTNIFSIVSGVVLCANVGDMLAKGKLPLSPRIQGRLSCAAGLGIACLFLLVVTGQWNRWGEGNKPFALGEAKDWFIHGPAKFAGQPGFPDRAFVANNGQAAVYSYHNYPPRTVFMDGRLEVCTLKTFKLYNEILYRMGAGDPGWQLLFDRSTAPLPAVILDTRTSLIPLVGMMHTRGWRMVYADPSGAVFLDDASADKLHLEQVDWGLLQLKPKVAEAIRRMESEMSEGRRAKTSE